MEIATRDQVREVESKIEECRWLLNLSTPKLNSEDAVKTLLSSFLSDDNPSLDGTSISSSGKLPCEIQIHMPAISIATGTGSRLGP